MALVLATLASLTARASGVDSAARGAARARPSWHDARRTVRGPEPIDAGDAASRRARSQTERTRDSHQASQKSARANRPEPAHDGWGARRGHATRDGSGRHGFGASTSRSERRALLADETLAAAEAANVPNALWHSLADVPPSLRCSGCELTLAALHARSATAARRLRPPSWMAASDETREALVGQHWNRACGALAADATLEVVDGTFYAGEAFISRVWEEATDVVLRNGTSVHGNDVAETLGAETLGAATDAARAVLSVCALLRRDARAKAHLTGVIVSGGAYPFERAFVRSQCFLITDASCRVDGRSADEKEEL